MMTIVDDITDNVMTNNSNICSSRCWAADASGYSQTSKPYSSRGRRARRKLGNTKTPWERKYWVSNRQHGIEAHTDKGARRREELSTSWEVPRVRVSFGHWIFVLKWENQNHKLFSYFPFSVLITENRKRQRTIPYLIFFDVRQNGKQELK